MHGIACMSHAIWPSMYMHHAIINVLWDDRDQFLWLPLWVWWLSHALQIKLLIIWLHHRSLFLLCHGRPLWDSKVEAFKIRAIDRRYIWVRDRRRLIVRVIASHQVRDLFSKWGSFTFWGQLALITRYIHSFAKHLSPAAPSWNDHHREVRIDAEVNRRVLLTDAHFLS